MLTAIEQLWKDDEAATAVEYGLMIALVAAVIIVGAAALGQGTTDGITSFTKKMKWK